MYAQSQQQPTLTHESLAAAFEAAARDFGDRSFKLRGRGHDPRVCLRSHPSRMAARVGVPHDVVCVGYKTAGPRRVFPADIVCRAAQYLGVDPDALVTENYQGMVW